MNKLISIIIPVYNTSRYIKKCLDSIIHQDYSNFEVIMVDDCSTDNTLDIIKEYVEQDSRFKLYQNTENLGCGLTRRKAISYGTGDYFCFIDSDDYVEQDYLLTLLNACLETNSEIAICGTFNRDDNYEYQSQDIAEKQYITSKEELYKQYMLSSWILQYNGNKIYSKRVIDSVIYCDLRYCEDSMTTYKWLWEANQAVVIPKSLYHYIHHEDSNSNKNNEPAIKAYYTCVCVYDHWKFCVEHGFDYMFKRLQEYIKPHLSLCVRTFNDDKLDDIVKIRDEIFE